MGFAKPQKGDQRRPTKFIMKDYESSYPERLKQLKLPSIPNWLEAKDLIFFFKCLKGLYHLDTSSFVTFSSVLGSRTCSNEQKILKPISCITSLFNDFFHQIVFIGIIFFLSSGAAQSFPLLNANYI